MKNILYVSLYTLNLKECYLAKTKVILANTENTSGSRLEMLEFEDWSEYFSQNFKNEYLYLQFT